MANPSSKKGTAFETSVRVWLQERAHVSVRREVKHGNRDQGDLHATIHGRKVVIECKCVEQVTAGLMEKYKRQTVEECENAGGDIGVLVMWRPGRGYRYDERPTGQRAKSFGDNDVYLTFESLLNLSGATGDISVSELALGTWLRMSLTDLALLSIETREEQA